MRRRTEGKMESGDGAEILDGCTHHPDGFRRGVVLLPR